MVDLRYRLVKKGLICMVIDWKLFDCETKAKVGVLVKYYVALYFGSCFCLCI